MRNREAGTSHGTTLDTEKARGARTEGRLCDRDVLGRCRGSSSPLERIEFEFLGDWQLGSMAIEMDLDQRIYGSVGWPALEKATIVAPMWA